MSTQEMIQGGKVSPLNGRKDWLFEIAVIAIWTLWIGRDFLDFNRYVWPIGREFGSQIQTHHIWTALKECGLCFLWNGRINGGAPAFADIFGSKLHPFVALSTILFGVINGAKISILLAFMTAGLSQWWIAKNMGLGRIPRIWSSLLVITAGHLMGKLEIGAVGLVISIATSSLVVAAFFNLAIKNDNRGTVILAFAMLSAILSGQGYAQIGLLGWLPAIILINYFNGNKFKIYLKNYLISAGLTMLMGAFFLLPTVRFWSNFSKVAEDSFKFIQPLESFVLNLVIGDFGFMTTEILGKIPAPWLYNIYIGWIPIIFAILCLYFVYKNDVGKLLFFLFGIIVVFLLSTGFVIEWLGEYYPQLYGVRFPSLFASVAIPGLLALSAYGVDKLIKAEWPKISIDWISQGKSNWKTKLNLSWILVVPLIASLNQTYTVNRGFLDTVDMYPVYQAVENLNTTDLQWVSTPFGDHFWVEPALDAGYKINNVVWAWGWVNRIVPLAKITTGIPEDLSSAEYVGMLGDDIPVYKHTEINYAYIVSDNENVACNATGGNGTIRVNCISDKNGVLVVSENMYNGWRVWVDGEASVLLPGDSLRTEANSGSHEYIFRYLPWDVPVGLGFTILGIVLCFRLWVRPGQRNNIPSDPTKENSPVS